MSIISQATIEKKLKSFEGLDGIQELISGGKESHGPGWLIGRYDTKIDKNATSAPTDECLEELTKKVRRNLIEEMEAKIEKVNQKNQENFTLLLKRLADANPGLKIDLDQIPGTTSGETGGDGNPLTGGPSSQMSLLLWNWLQLKTF